MGLATPVFSTMYVISTSLLYPVIVVLIGLVGWSIVMLGAFLSEYTTRHRSMEELDRVAMKAREALSKGDVEGAASTLESVEAAPFVREFLQKLAASMRQGAQRKTEKLMDDYELMTMRVLEKTVLGAKVGPMVGLMGTLIPMGPALSGLASGNVEQMVTNLIIAFATTVLGLAAGIVCYTITLVRRRWYAQDMSDIEYVVGVLEG
ncbi:MAG: MotA/TolQ/ExbB proton channel family protein [Methermicoccaceae archaeon]